jgi:hypothetical protein
VTDTLPFPTILFQSFFVMLAIAIESSVFHYRLNLSRKDSIEYAGCINLFATIFGWLMFFYTEALLPENLRLRLIDFVFFNRYFVEDLTPILAIVFFAFFSTFFVKVLGAKLINRMRHINEALTVDEQRETEEKFHKRKTESYITERRQALAILRGHSYSHTSILLILLLKDLTPLGR